MSGVVTKSITAENTFSDVMKTQGYFNLSISGIAGGTVVTVQKQSGVDGTSWTTVDTFSSDIETFGFEAERQNYRVGVVAGSFGSGTCKVRLGCKWIDYLSS
tara:strand:- start:336 stop:641 length:306 start_codon:yes stop_codon:yes gene_type:complete